MHRGKGQGLATWAQFGTTYTVTEQLGPICQLSVNVGGATTLVTPVRIAGER